MGNKKRVGEKNHKTGRRSLFGILKSSVFGTCFRLLGSVRPDTMLVKRVNGESENIAVSRTQNPSRRIEPVMVSIPDRILDEPFRKE